MNGFQSVPPVNQYGVNSHPYINTYSDYQKKYSIWNPQFNGNNDSNQTDLFTKGEFPYNHKLRYVVAFNPGDRYNSLFHVNSIAFMSKMITRLLAGVHPEGKNIIVPDETIRSVADSVFEATGQSTDIMQQMIINYIVDAVRTEMQTIEKNNKYSIWIQKYDEATGLKQFSDVKTNEKSRSPYFQIRY
jgi:hypothetical protein